MPESSTSSSTSKIGVMAHRGDWADEDDSQAIRAKPAAMLQLYRVLPRPGKAGVAADFAAGQKFAVFPKKPTIFWRNIAKNDDFLTELYLV
jgi:hypothetical protein